MLRLLGLACGLQQQVQLAEHFTQFLRVGLDHQHVVGLQHPARVGRAQAQLVAHHGDHLGVGFVEQLLDLAQGLALGHATFLDPGLGQVVAGIEAGGIADLASGDQAPAEQGDEQHAGQRHGDTDRAEVEHGEGAVAVLCAKAGDDQVRWRADQRGHAAEDGAEGQRHEDAPRRHFQARGDLQGDGHQQGEGADVVHERRQQGAQAGQGGDRQQHAGATGNQAQGEAVDRAGTL